MGIKANMLALSLLITLVLSCNKKDNQQDNSNSMQETSAEQIGDVMASIDEAGGSSGSFAMMMREEKLFAKLAPELTRDSIIGSWLLPKAYGASCISASAWGSCTSNQIVRSFNDCTIGLSTFSGTVTLAFDDDNDTDNTCSMTTQGHSVSRSPSFTITGPKGGQFTVSKTGTVGQMITRGATASDYSFSNDGIRRTLTYQGTTLADFTTQTTSAITVTGSSRSNRVLSGGSLQVTNNLTDVTCDFTPTNVTWDESCTCPVSGSWSTSCSDGKSGSLSITSCGSGTFTLGESTQTVSFDRCIAI